MSTPRPPAKKGKRKPKVNPKRKAAINKALPSSDPKDVKSESRAEELYDAIQKQALSEPRHERFASLVAQGYSATDAYMECYKGCNSRRSANVGASKLRNQPEVIERIKQLASLVTTRDCLTMRDRRLFLARVIRANPSKLDMEKDGDLCEQWRVTPEAIIIKLPGKRECIMDDAKLAGDLVEKVEHSGQVENRIKITDELVADIQDRRRKAIIAMQTKLRDANINSPAAGSLFEDA
jgi:hypothetical protein